MSKRLSGTCRRRNRSSRAGPSASPPSRCRGPAAPRSRGTGWSPRRRRTIPSRPPSKVRFSSSRLMPDRRPVCRRSGGRASCWPSDRASRSRSLHVLPHPALPPATVTPAKPRSRRSAMLRAAPGLEAGVSADVAGDEERAAFGIGQLPLDCLGAFARSRTRPWSCYPAGQWRYRRQAATGARHPGRSRAG